MMRTSLRDEIVTTYRRLAAPNLLQFSYFADFPWAHLRLSKEAIVDRLKQQKSDADLRENFGVSPETYVRAMLNPDHLNGLTLDKFNLAELSRPADIEILKLNRSYEGENLPTPAIVREIKERLPHLERSNLVEHGFELAFRKR